MKYSAKWTALLLSAAVLLGTLSACGGSSGDAQTDGDAQTGGDAAEEITVTGMDANGEPVEVTVPFKPERVVVLDLANLDILDNLGLGDRVVGVPTVTLPYLESYNDAADIVGSVKTPDLEAVMACEPDLILMGGRMAEYYDQLGGIAPTLRLTTVSDDGLVEAIRANATTIGAIFNESEQVDELLAQYDARIAALSAFAEGKTCVLGMSTSGSFNLLGNDGRCSLIVNEIGFDNIGADAATTGSNRGGSDSSERSGSDSGERSGEHSGSRGEAVTNEAGAEGAENSGTSTPHPRK